MKRIIKAVFYSPLGVYLCRLMRVVYKPSERRAGWMKFKGRFRVKAEDDTTFWLYNNAFIFETMIFWLGLERYSWEKTTRKTWIRLCRKSSLILDIGANSGVFSVLANAYNPKATLIAFEPQPNIYEALKLNNSVNDFDIQCEKLALSNTEGVLPFYNYGPETFSSINTTAGSLNPDWRAERQSAIEVKVTRLDHYLEQHQPGNVELMKIDVETLEYEVLDGYGELLKLHRPAILLEIQHPHIGDKIVELLAGSRYIFYSIDESRGLIQTPNPGHQSDNRNYLLLPEERIDEIRDLVCNYNV